MKPPIHHILAPVILTLILQNICCAWSEGGHHVIALLAYDLLTDAEQAEVLSILEDHPRFSDDFRPPRRIRDAERWRIGQAGFWPDVARRQPKYNRPNWHYQPGAALTVGNEVLMNIPQSPEPCPADANLDSEELHIAQAVELCRRILNDQDQPAGNRAIALSWLAHLVADAHQPCHAGSLFAEDVFPGGDRQANLIEIVQGKNLHALWDGLLGQRYDEQEVSNQIESITHGGDAMKAGPGALKRPDPLDPLTWIDESRTHARSLVYSTEVMGPIRATAEGIADEVPRIDLSAAYLERAKSLAEVRAVQAAYRLAEIWREAVSSASPNKE